MPPPAGETPCHLPSPASFPIFPPIFLPSTSSPGSDGRCGGHEKPPVPRQAHRRGHRLRRGHQDARRHPPPALLGRDRPARRLSPAPALRGPVRSGARTRLVRHHRQAQNPRLHPEGRGHLRAPDGPLLRTRRADHGRPHADCGGLRPVDRRSGFPARERTLRRADHSGRPRQPRHAAPAPRGHADHLHRLHLLNGPAAGRRSGTPQPARQDRPQKNHLRLRAAQP